MLKNRFFPWVMTLSAFLLSATAVFPMEPIAEKDFVCRGDGAGRMVWEGKEYRDCPGGHLPAGGVRPELLALLNALQARVGAALVLTSGYRCEAHNRYSWACLARDGDAAGVSRRSLHRSGAAADFYVEGVRDISKYRTFAEELRRTAAASPGKTVWTRVYGAEEVRDPDNRHDYPYIHVHLLGVPRRPLEPASD